MDAQALLAACKSKNSRFPGDTSKAVLQANQGQPDLLMKVCLELGGALDKEHKDLQGLQSIIGQIRQEARRRQNVQSENIRQLQAQIQIQDEELLRFRVSLDESK
jgi:hypothetical protein